MGEQALQDDAERVRLPRAALPADEGVAVEAAGPDQGGDDVGTGPDRPDLEVVPGPGVERVEHLPGRSGHPAPREGARTRLVDRAVGHLGEDPARAGHRPADEGDVEHLAQEAASTRALDECEVAGQVTGLERDPACERAAVDGRHGVVGSVVLPRHGCLPWLEVRPTIPAPGRMRNAGRHSPPASTGVGPRKRHRAGRPADVTTGRPAPSRVDRGVSRSHARGRRRGA